MLAESSHRFPGYLRFVSVLRQNATWYSTSLFGGGIIVMDSLINYTSNVFRHEGWNHLVIDSNHFRAEPVDLGNLSAARSVIKSFE